jgi:hypothetical protein
MTALSVLPPFPVFTDIDGQSLEDGYIWIGVANLAPITNPIAVYWDAALTIPAPLPIRTRGGYPVNSGTPARLYVGSDYSIQVQDKNGSVVYTAPVPTERLGGAIVISVTNIIALRAATWISGRPEIVQLVSNWATGDGGGVFRWDAASTATDDGGITIKETATLTGRWIRQDIQRTRKISWFGAISPTVDSSAAVNAAIMSLPVIGGDVIVDGGIIAIASPIIIGDGTSTVRSTRVGVRLVGQGGVGVGEGNYGTPNFCTTFRWIGTKASTQTMLEIRGPIHSIGIERIAFDGAGRAGRPVQIRHMFNSYMDDLRVERFWECGVDFRSNDAALPFGVTSGSAINTFKNLNTGDPWEEGTAIASKNNAIAMRMHGGPINNIAME